MGIMDMIGKGSTSRLGSERVKQFFSTDHLAPSR